MEPQHVVLVDTLDAKTRGVVKPENRTVVVFAPHRPPSDLREFERVAHPMAALGRKLKLVRPKDPGVRYQGVVAESDHDRLGRFELRPEVIIAFEDPSLPAFDCL